MNIQIVNSLDEEVWRAFVDQHPNGNIFHTPEMFQVFNHAKGHHPQLWASMDETGNIHALMTPVQVTLRDGILSRLTTRSIAYGSVLCTPDAIGKKALTMLLDAYQKEINRTALLTELRNLSDISAFEQVFNQSGYIYEAHLDYLIDIKKKADDVWRAISKNGRKNIRKSINKGLIAEEIVDPSLIPTFYGLLQQTYNRARIPLADISLFEAVFNELVPKGMAKLFLARVGNSYIAASLEMPYKKDIYSFYSGYDWGSRGLHPNDFLVWHILEWGINNGYSCFDFGGAGRPDETFGVRDFKSKFGGELVNFGRYKCIHAPLILGFSEVGYRIYRQVLRFIQMSNLNRHNSKIVPD